MTGCQPVVVLTGASFECHCSVPVCSGVDGNSSPEHDVTFMEAEQGFPDNGSGSSGAPALRVRTAADTMAQPLVRVQRTQPTSLHISIQLEGQMYLYGEQYVVHRP